MKPISQKNLQFRDMWPRNRKKIAQTEVFGYFVDFALLVLLDFSHNVRWTSFLVVFLQFIVPVNVSLLLLILLSLLLLLLLLLFLLILLVLLFLLLFWLVLLLLLLVLFLSYYVSCRCYWSFSVTGFICLINWVIYFVVF